MESTENLKKNRNLSHPADGIDFGTRKFMSFKITHKDIILVAGILVAIIIALTTWMMDNQSQAESGRFFPIPKVKHTVLYPIISKTILSKF
ncbi:MAG TPA: hypothetical protein PLM56_01510 [Cyclobacteriaceae bacterium]|jgi:hypothetical protein|nr:hypothetical protein [Cytophagales bacterium]HNT51000.1 hypothetical protein [Cyclobacteriaceae bacterium]HRE66163.1 hypothetical protein [Cyclobacteriaceae bacterium]HRF32146.1 hypothetical protein [Cyclobacteriaceae bacterium]